MKTIQRFLIAGALLLRMMTPLAENDARVTKRVEALKEVREDGEVSSEESARLLDLLKSLNLTR